MLMIQMHKAQSTKSAPKYQILHVKDQFSRTFLFLLYVGKRKFLIDLIPDIDSNPYIKTAKSLLSHIELIY